jgi:hypothetical protein
MRRSYSEWHHHAARSGWRTIGSIAPLKLEAGTVRRRGARSPPRAAHGAEWVINGARRGKTLTSMT